ncbi:MAG: hypothetical protein QXP52_03300 [Candidatus Aenigmatarchaeota archaeon]
MAKMQNLLEKAILHELSEKFGFEEAKMYWAILHNKNLDKYNRSRKYRIFENLFNCGLLLKVKEGKLFEYMPTPPTFISLFLETGTKLIEEKEKVYFERYNFFFKAKKIFMELTGEVVDGMMLFLVKYFMKKNAYIIMGGPPIYLILKQRIKRFKDIKFIGVKEYFKNEKVEDNIILLPQEIIGDRRLCLIDDSILMALFKTVDNIYVGYLTTNKDKIKEKLSEIKNLSSLRQ